MPVVSRFLGIVIAMPWKDHAPAHVHAKYGENETVVHIATGVAEGQFPKNAPCDKYWNGSSYAGMNS